MKTAVIETKYAVIVASKSAAPITSTTTAPIKANSAVPMAPKSLLEKEHAAKMAAKAAIAAARARVKLQPKDVSNSPEASSSSSPPKSPPKQPASTSSLPSTKRSIADVDAPDEQQPSNKLCPEPAQAPPEPVQTLLEEPELLEPVFIPYGDYSVPILYAQTVIHRDDRLLNDPSFELMDEAVYLLDRVIDDSPKEPPKKEQATAPRYLGKKKSAKKERGFKAQARKVQQ
jgi:hypothetical protein